MQNVKPFLVRFARSAVQEPAKPDPPPPPTTIHTRVKAETTDDN